MKGKFVNMITKKEKIAIQIVYEEYKKNKNPNKIYMKTNELIDKSCGRLSLPDLHALILHGNSQYIGFHVVDCSVVNIKPMGISYMEGKSIRIVRSIAFWVFGVSSLVAAIYSILSFYSK